MLSCCCCCYVTLLMTHLLAVAAATAAAAADTLTITQDWLYHFLPAATASATAISRVISSRLSEEWQRHIRPLPLTIQQQQLYCIDLFSVHHLLLQTHNVRPAAPRRRCRPLIASLYYNVIKEESSEVHPHTHVMCGLCKSAVMVNCCCCCCCYHHSIGEQWQIGSLYHSKASDSGRWWWESCLTGHLHAANNGSNGRPYQLYHWRTLSHSRPLGSSKWAATAAAPLWSESSTVLHFILHSRLVICCHLIDSINLIHERLIS